MADKTRFAKQVALYLEYRPLHLETNSGLPEEPMGKKHKGSSRPPVNNRGIRWIDEAVSFTKLENGEKVVCTHYENRKHHALLNHIVESYRLGFEKSGGIALSDVVAMLWDDSSAVTWMIDGRSETARAYHGAFRALCRKIAGDFLQVESGVEFSVEVPAYESRVRSIREAGKQDTRMSWRRIVAALEEIEADGSSRQDAKSRLVDEWRKAGRNLSIGRINDALAFVKKERGNGAA